ncbi:MAG: hypothetical protein J5792_00115 [Bacteroidales bacterium]|nr:hypothetical protein [Bacteroidales bacterium]
MDMSLDYLNDIYGKNRKQRIRFSELEENAAGLIGSFVHGTMNDKDFAKAFNEIRSKFMDLTNVNGETTFDQDTPLWLNMLLGNHFIPWLRFQQVKWYFEEHPEEFTEERKEQFARIQAMGYDEKFKDACKDVLKELKGNF